MPRLIARLIRRHRAARRLELVQVNYTGPDPIRVAQAVHAGEW